MTKFISLENHYGSLAENEGSHNDFEFQRNLEIDELREEAIALNTGTRIERVMRSKVDRDEDLTDEEIYIATETIGNLYSNMGTGIFSGFGFESYEGKELTQKQKSKIALEAISNQNAEKFKTWKAKFERFTAGLSDYFSWFTGNQQKLKEEAKDLLDKINSSSENDFIKENVTDKRVSIAVYRGTNKKPFSNYKEVLKALESLTSSAKILASGTKYESIGGKDGGKWDLAQLAKDMKARLINQRNGKATYDLNPEMINGFPLTITIPDDSESNYLMRNLKANFVVSVGLDGFDYSLDGGYSDVNVKALTKKEATELCKAVIQHIDEVNGDFRKFYSESKIGVTDIVKIVGKTLVSGIIPPMLPLVYVNSLVFRSRMQDINTRLHYLNRGATRGLLAWAASSIK